MRYSREAILDQVGETVVDPFGLVASDRRMATYYLQAAVILESSDNVEEQVEALNQMGDEELRAMNLAASKRDMAILLEDIDSALLKFRSTKRSET